MDVNFSPEDERQRAIFRAFFVDNYSAELDARIKDDVTYMRAIMEWQRILFDHGFGAPHWPTEYGGRGWDTTRQYIWEAERARHGAAAQHVMGVTMIGPIIITYGTAEQKAQHLPHILSGDRIWCQGYSEPNAGSDLASLVTTATRNRNDYLINGSKIWTSGASEADWMFALVRTDRSRAKHAGISMILIDMKSPGISVRPIRSIDGSRNLNQVFFDNARVPIENLIGEENMGWTYANRLLGHERLSVIPVHSLLHDLEVIKTIARRDSDSSDHIMTEDQVLHSEIAEIEVELMALEFTMLRVLDNSIGHVGSSILKLKGSELWQRIDKLRLRLTGAYGCVSENIAGTSQSWQEFVTKAQKRLLFGLSHTIYGGSSEIQRNIIAKLGLGLRDLV